MGTVISKKTLSKGRVARVLLSSGESQPNRNRSSQRLTTIVNQSSVFLSPIRQTNAKRCSTRPLVGVVDVFAENRGRNGRKWQTLRTVEEGEGG